MQAGNVSLYRLQRLLRGARLVGCCANNQLVLWADDAQDLGAINRDEIVLLQYDPQAGTITQTQLEWPADMSDAQRQALNAKVALSDLEDPDSALLAMGNPTYRTPPSWWPTRRRSSHLRRRASHDAQNKPFPDLRPGAQALSLDSNICLRPRPSPKLTAPAA